MNLNKKNKINLTRIKCLWKLKIQLPSIRPRQSRTTLLVKLAGLQVRRLQPVFYSTKRMDYLRKTMAHAIKVVYSRSLSDSLIIIPQKRKPRCIRRRIGTQFRVTSAKSTRRTTPDRVKVKTICTVLESAAT